jgi:hypothetical protein
LSDDLERFDKLESEDKVRDGRFQALYTYSTVKNAQDEGSSPGNYKLRHKELKAHAKYGSLLGSSSFSWPSFRNLVGGLKNDFTLRLVSSQKS